MALQNAESTVAKAVEFINSGPTIVEVYYPRSGERRPPIPVLVAMGDEDAIAWLGGSAMPYAEQVEYVEKRSDGSFRVVLDAITPTELHLFRPRTSMEKEQAEAARSLNATPSEMMTEKLDLAKRRDPWPERNQEFHFSRWFQGPYLKGVVVIGEQGMRFRSIHQEDEALMTNAASHYAPYDWYTKEAGLELLKDLAERPVIGRDVTAPEYIKAADIDDAAQIARDISLKEFMQEG